MASKHYLLVVVPEDGAPATDINNSTLVDDFDQAFGRLCEAVYDQQGVSLELRTPKPGPFNFSVGQMHYQIWETNIPPKTERYATH